MRRTAIAMIAALLAGCSARPAPEPAPAAPPPPRTQAEAPVLPPPPAAADWSDLPLAPGDWRYAGENGGSEARFGPEGAADFRLRCSRSFRQVAIEWQGVGGPLWIRTSYGARILPEAGGLDPDDPLLDEMAFSRGRFAVEGDDARQLIVPAGPEVGRVVEDCRG